MNTEKFKVVIAGGRDFSNYQLLKEKMDWILSRKLDSQIVIVSGGAKGADKLGERYANEMGYEIEEYLPDWDTYGKAAGFKRNVQLVDNADAVVCFWNGSKGTGHTIDITKKAEKPLIVIKY